MEFDKLLRWSKHKISEPKASSLSDIEEDLKRNDRLRQIFRSIGAWPLGYIGSEAMLFH